MINARKTIIFIAFLSTMMVARAQNFVVSHVVGRVTNIVQGKSHQLGLNARLSEQSVVNIPYGGRLEVIDERGSRQIILRQAGHGTIKSLAESQNNSISKLTGKYLTYVKHQLTRKGLASRQRYSDMATVTRRRDSIAAAKQKNAPSNPFAAKFDLFKKESQKTFEDFRDKCNREYIAFVRKAWKEFGAEPPVRKPPVPEVPPVVFEAPKPKPQPKIVPKDEPSENPLNDSILERRKLKELTVVIPDIAIDIPQPKPIEVVREQPIEPEDTAYAVMPFTFMATDMQVRLDETKRFNIDSITPDHVADMLEVLSSKDYDNVLFDCLKLRSEHKLCDWAYLLMLKTIADQFCGEGTNEAALLLGYLYCQSGYKMRYATDGTKLYVLISSRHNIYDKWYFTIDNDRFYPVDDSETGLNICNVEFPKEQALSLYIRNAQVFGNTEYRERDIKSRSYPEVNFHVKVGNGLMEFYDSYPTSYVEDNFTTRWAMYAETPMEESVKEQVYPLLRKELEGLSPLEAAERLLNLVQTGFEYEFDEKVWGHDRAFFAEESLYYPYCDCEDRSILFTRLVRDLLGLKCVLIYYPGHLASAVDFQGQATEGEYYVYDNAKYTVCDPTYIGAGVGRQMPGLELDKAVLIPIK